MATLPTREIEELRSAVSQLTNTIYSLSDAKEKEAQASTNAANADNQEANASKNSANSVGGALGKVGNAALNTVNAMYGLAKTFASIAESGRQFAEKTGATATRGVQFQLDMNRILLSDIRKFGADQQVIAEQIRGAATSFADTFVGAAAGMQISARGSAEFARSLNVGFKSEFTLTAQSMRALVTVGAATTREFDAFRRASGRAGLSSGQFANLVNKNTLSFMLYGPSFARAAVSAERLGISLTSVQKAQESMVTNLDGTIDTIAQLNQLGAGIDFGTLITLAETQGPEATLRYLQSTIPPSLFQSASTRALISKLGIPLEDLLKRQGSVQASAADRIEQAFTEVARPASQTAKSLADLNKNLKALDEAKVMEILNGVMSVGRAIWGLVDALKTLIINTYLAAARILKTPGGVPPVAPVPLVGGSVPPVVPTKTPPPLGFMTNEFGATPYMPPAPPPAPKLGFFGKLKGGLASILGDDIVRAASATRAAVAGSSTVTGIATGAKALGPVGGAVTAALGGYTGFQQGKEKGFTNEEATGFGAMRAATGISGGIIGGALTLGNPIGVAIGAVIGDTIGSFINKNFPYMALVISDTFAEIKTALVPLIEKIMGPGGLWPAIKELATNIGAVLLPPLKVVAYIIGTVVTGAFVALGATIKVMLGIVGFVIDFITGSVKLAAKLIEAIWNGTLDLIKAMIPGSIGDDAIESMKIKKTVEVATPAAVPASTGNDVVASSGYGDRTLVTPNGAIALNNRDTVVAYADDMMSGIKTYSLGTLSKQMSNDGGELGRKVDELITVLREANTTIQIDNTVRQVPRMAVSSVGAYTRNERI